MDTSRRKFIKNTLLTSAAIPLSASLLNGAGLGGDSGELDISIFSKHLQFLDYRQTGQKAAELGFDGVDLTVRPKGHVLPENVIADLPKAIREIKEGGSQCKMITTSIESVENKYDTDIIRTAAENGLEYYRAHWFKYLSDRSMEASISYYQEQVAALSIYNEKHNIVGCYQNHAGTKVGASFWGIKQLLEKANPEYFGAQYDIRHATAEGGHSWPNGLKLLRDSIKVIVLKDFKWGIVDGKWKAVNVPIGEGMVDFKRYFGMLKAFNIKPPVSLHLEYPLGGAEKGKSNISVDPSVVYNAMHVDLEAIRKIWKEA